MYNNNETPIIYKDKADSIAKPDANKNVVSEREQQTSEAEYSNMMAIEIKLDELIEITKQNQQKAKELNMILESYRY